MKTRIIHARSDICRDCPTPCEWQNDSTKHADPQAACHISRWGAYSAPLGDRIEEQIESRILAPLERFAPSLARSLRQCGGCKQAKRALNQESDNLPQS